VEGKYRVVGLLGEGGMGAVYEAENVRIHRRVAVKVLHGGIAENKDVVARFEREAQAAGHIGSEHIVEVLDLGNLPDGSRFMIMTRTGSVMGTPYYMSPEQAKGAKDSDHRSDLYAVGVILYEAVTGRVPFDGETFNELLFKIALEPPPPLASLVPDLDANFGA